MIYFKSSIFSPNEINISETLTNFLSAHIKVYGEKFNRLVLRNTLGVMTK